MGLAKHLEGPRCVGHHGERAILECTFPLEGGGEVVIMNTHLDAFAHGTDTMEKQIAKVDERISIYEEADTPWLIGGDFNLIPPGMWRRLWPEHQVWYKKTTEIAPLYEKYGAIPA